MVQLSTQASDRDLLLISVFTFITVSLWVFFEILKTAKTTTITASTTQIVQPLNPKINTDTLETLARKRVY